MYFTVGDGQCSDERMAFVVFFRIGRARNQEEDKELTSSPPLGKHALTATAYPLMGKQAV